MDLADADFDADRARIIALVAVGIVSRDGKGVPGACCQAGDEKTRRIGIGEFCDLNVPDKVVRRAEVAGTEIDPVAIEVLFAVWIPCKPDVGGKGWSS